MVEFDFVGRRDSPPFEGGVDATSRKLRAASFDGADGVVIPATDNRWLEITTPSAPAKVASQHFLVGAATPPSKGGD